MLSPSTRTVDLVLKRRVWYQPFCPSMLESERGRLLADWTGDHNPCMTMAYSVLEHERARLAAVTSIDGTCRPQFVPDDEPGAFAAVLRPAPDSPLTSVTSVPCGCCDGAAGSGCSAG